MAIFESNLRTPCGTRPHARIRRDVQKPAVPVQFYWAYVLVLLGVVAAIGAGVGAALFIKKRRESGYETEAVSQ